MNLIDTSIESMRRIAENASVGEGIDEHWKAVLPDSYDIIANEVFLTLNRHYIDELMKCWARDIAQSLPPRDVSNIVDATLVLHIEVREMWLGIADNPEFQAYVDNNVKGVIHAVRGVVHKPNLIEWAKSLRLWPPPSTGFALQFGPALIERYKQVLFAERCWTELRRSCPAGNEFMKHTFVLLNDCDEFDRQRTQGFQWLRDQSNRLDSEVGEDAMQDWLEELSELPLHMQIQKVGVTRKAIHNRAIDMRRKGGKYGHVSFEGNEEHVDGIPDVSLEAPDYEIMSDEFLQLLSANQQKIEELLSQESPKKRQSKIGKRRFEVMQMLTRTPTPTSVEIAKALGASEQTIGRDRHAIGQCWPAIHDAIYSQ